jgi:hypothetical protein
MKKSMKQALEINDSHEREAPVKQVTVSPRNGKRSREFILLDATIKDHKGCERKFKPEVNNGCSITSIHPRLASTQMDLTIGRKCQDM